MRAYRFRCYPTAAQTENLLRTFGCVRLIYNKALDARTKAWYRRKERINYAQTSALLTRWKRRKDLDFLNEVSSVPLQQALRHLQSGYVGFWEGHAKYPRFKRKRTSGSATYTRSAFTWRDNYLKLAKHAESLRVRWSRPLPPGSEPSSVAVSRDSAGRWFVSLLVEEDIPALAERTESVGVDAGLSSLFTLSTGEKITNPRHERRDRERIKFRQKELARKQKGGKNFQKAKLKLARAHARIADRRLDAMHKFTTRLVRENQVICVEDLNVRGMMSNHTLARAIADASWATFRRLLEYKCEWHGRDLVAIDRFHPSSKVCSACGTLKATISSGERTFKCPDTTCGQVEDRDVNAAKNILAAGLAVTACGDGIRPKRS